jgi:hypothetical protein
MIHHPKILTGWLNPDYQKDDIPETTPILRETDAYMDFLFLFGRFGAKTEKFKNRYGNSPLSSFVSCNMEAFLVTVYTLNYNFWLQKTGLDEDNERPAPTEKTILLTRGSPDNGGWSDPAIIMYGRIIREIREQRKRLGFDRELQQEWIKENEGHSSTTGKNSNQKSQEYRSASGEADMDFEENCENNHEYSKLLYPL